MAASEVCSTSAPARGRRSRRLARCLAITALAFCAPGAAAASSAGEVGPGARDEARRRFDQGLLLYEAGDFNGALAEFQRAYALAAHPVVLFNVALVQAKLGNAVEAVEAVEALRAGGLAALGAERQARAERTYAEQLQRIGTVELRTNAEGAVVQVDNVDIAPGARARLRLTAGQHLVSAFAPLHAPKHVAVRVLGGAHQVVEVELVPLQVNTARLALTSNVPDVEVRLGGELVAKLPLATELTVAPGRHELELSRAGYTSAKRQLDLTAGGHAALAFELLPTPEGLSQGGRLQLAISEPNAVVTVDGAPRAIPEDGIALPRGRHVLRVERAGFFEVAREVEVGSGTTRIDATLLPTPRYLADYVASAERTRTFAYVTGGTGLAVLAASGGFLLWNQAQKDDAAQAFDDFVAEVEGQPGGTCNDEECEATLKLLFDDLDQKRKRDVYGWVGVGVGGTALVAGALLYWLGDDPSRYDPRPESDVFARLAPVVGPGMLGLSGKF